MLRRAYKFKLYENKKLNAFYEFSGSCRFIWNKGLALNNELLEQGKLIHYYNDLAKLLMEWKKDSELAWLYNTPSQALQQTLKDLERAFKDGFDKKQPLKEMPTLKKKHKATKSFRIPVAPKVEGNKIFVPKVGWLKFHKSQEILGKMKNYTISEHCGSWYVSIQTELAVTAPIHSSSSQVGIDLGIAKHATLSNGTIYHLPDLTKWEDKKKELQQELSRRTKFSSNWKKTKRKLAKVSSKIARIRKDYLHKISTEIAKNHSHIVLEDLKVKEMSKSNKGTAQQHGTNVKVKSEMNKAILNQGWYNFRIFLQYKTAWNGGLLTLVEPYNTSRECSECGYIDAANRKTQARFQCCSCGHAENADINAAKVILKRSGHRPSVLAS